MNSRRGFFKTLVAGALAAALPKPKVVPQEVLDALEMNEFFRRKLLECARLRFANCVAWEVDWRIQAAAELDFLSGVHWTKEQLRDRGAPLLL